MQNPRQYKIPDWFLNRQKDIKDGKFAQLLANELNIKLRGAWRACIPAPAATQGMVGGPLAEVVLTFLLPRRRRCGAHEEDPIAPRYPPLLGVRGLGRAEARCGCRAVRSRTAAAQWLCSVRVRGQKTKTTGRGNHTVGIGKKKAA
jgi:hypothetical protein